VSTAVTSTQTHTHTMHSKFTPQRAIRRA